MKILPKHPYQNVLRLNSNTATASSPAATLVNAISMFLPGDENKNNSHTAEEKHDNGHNFHDEFLTDPKPIVERWIDTVKEYWWALGIGGIGALAYAIINAKIYRYKMGEAEKAHEEEIEEIKGKVSKLIKNGRLSEESLDEAFTSTNNKISNAEDEKIKRELIKQALEEIRHEHDLNDALITAISTRSLTPYDLHLDSLDFEDYDNLSKYKEAILKQIREMLTLQINKLKQYASY